ncbi:MAG: HD domain-containing phosphohydrolase [Bacillota bacterium]
METLLNLNITLGSEVKGAIQKLIDSLPFYVLLVDKDHTILLANQAVFTQLNKDPRNLIGSYCPKAIHNADGPIPECPLEDSVKKGCTIENEYYDVNYNKWLLSSIYPTSIKTPDGKTVYLHFTKDITEKKEAQRKLEESIIKLNQITNSIIKTLTLTVEKRDPYTAGHQLRVSKLGVEIAGELGLSSEEVECIRIAGLLHDIGKIAVPIEILSKPGRISSHEYSIIKEHPIVGYEIIREIDFPGSVSETVLQHHEKINGSGYPYGLTGKAIHIGAKIICVADVFEAMVSHRPYRQALPKETAMKELQKNKGILYDEDVVNKCLTVLHKGFSF